MQKSLMHVSELTEIFFEDAITAGLEQSGYVLLNLRGGVGLANGKKTLSGSGSNLTYENYIVSAGNTGSLLGDPARIAEAPRIFEAKITRKFYNFNHPKLTEAS